MLRRLRGHVTWIPIACYVDCHSRLHRSFFFCLLQRLPATAKRECEPATSSDVCAVPRGGALERELHDDVQPGGVHGSESVVERAELG